MIIWHETYQQKVFSYIKNILSYFLSFPHCLLTTLTFSMAILDLFLLYWSVGFLFKYRTTIHWWCSPPSPLKSNFWKREQTRAGSSHVLYSRKKGETLIISFHYYVFCFLSFVISDKNILQSIWKFLNAHVIEKKFKPPGTLLLISFLLCVIDEKFKDFWKTNSEK